MSTEATPTILQYQAHNQCREPDWRWQHARRIVVEGRRPSQRRDDPDSVTAAQYLRALQRCRTDRDFARLASRWPALRAAQQLAESDGPRLWEVQGRLLAGQTDEQIAVQCGLTPEIVNSYERIFFHVRDRLGARDWVTAKILGDGLRHGFARTQLGEVWQAFAYETIRTPAGRAA